MPTVFLPRAKLKGELGAKTGIASSRKTSNVMFDIKAKLEDGDIVIIHDRHYTPDLLEKLLPYINENFKTCVL